MLIGIVHVRKAVNVTSPTPSKCDEKDTCTQDTNCRFSHMCPPKEPMLYHVYTAEDDGRVFLWNSWVDEDAANAAARGVNGIVTAVTIVSDYRRKAE